MTLRPLRPARLFLTLALAIPLSVALPARAWAEPIRAFTYTGLRVVRAETVDRVTARYIGEEADDEAAKRIIADLRGLGFFSSVNLRWTDEGGQGYPGGGAVGTVVFGERQTFVALPMGGSRDGDFALGAAVVESNLFGSGKKIAAAGKVGTRSWSASARYSDPLAAGGTGTFAGAVALGRGIEKRTDAAGETIARYEALTLDAGASAGLRAGNGGMASIGAGLRSWDVGIDGESHDPPGDLAAPYVYVSAEWSRARWDGTFRSESSASFEAGTYAVKGGKPWVSARLSGQTPVREGCRITGTAAGSALLGDDPLLNHGAHGIGSFLMPDSYSAPRVVCVAAETELAALNGTLGTLALFAGGEAAAGGGGNSGTGAWYGPRGGLRVYFKKIAVPGVALTGGYDFSRNRPSFAFSMGIQY